MLPEHRDMSNTPQLWEDVEGFLNKPAPRYVPPFSFSRTIDRLMKTSLKQLVKKKSSKASQSKKILPSLRKEATKVRSSGYGAKSTNQESKQINHQLLQEAFAYVGQIKRNESRGSDVFEDMPALPRSGRLKAQTSTSTLPSSAAAGTKTKRKTKKKKVKSSTIYGSSKGSKSKASAGPGWNSSGITETNVLDASTMDELVQNFQTGASIAALRKKLANSQNSLNNSRQVLQSAAQNFYKGDG